MQRVHVGDVAIDAVDSGPLQLQLDLGIEVDHEHRIEDGMTAEVASLLLELEDHRAIASGTDPVPMTGVTHHSPVKSDDCFGTPTSNATIRKKTDSATTIRT